MNIEFRKKLSFYPLYQYIRKDGSQFVTALPPEAKLWEKMQPECIGRWQINIANLKVYRENYDWNRKD
jgi:hypothetical protein